MKSSVINIDPEIMSGTPVFSGTRVPIKTLFDYVQTGETLESFLDDFPTVKREQATQLLNMALKSISVKQLKYENSPRRVHPTKAKKRVKRI